MARRKLVGLLHGTHPRKTLWAVREDHEVMIFPDGKKPERRTYWRQEYARYYDQGPEWNFCVDGLRDAGLTNLANLPDREPRRIVIEVLE